jgi:hypothetical protein
MRSKGYVGRRGGEGSQAATEREACEVTVGPSVDNECQVGDRDRQDEEERARKLQRVDMYSHMIEK